MCQCTCPLPCSAELLGQEVALAPDCIGEEVKKAIAALQNGQVRVGAISSWCCPCSSATGAAAAAAVLLPLECVLFTQHPIAACFTIASR